ncbi:MAG: DUF3311 domain-containing protein [Sciscionella sp.]
MIRSWRSLLVGFGIPTVAILGGVLVLGHLSATVLGFPVVFFWMFCCFPLTTLCLWLAWHFFDRDHYQEVDS